MRRKTCTNNYFGNPALLFYPLFFGHMAFNSKDTILAFSHVWIFYYVLKYLKNQNFQKQMGLLGKKGKKNWKDPVNFYTEK